MEKKLGFTEKVFERVKLMCAQKEWDFEVNEQNQIAVKSKSSGRVKITSFPKLREIHVEYNEYYKALDVSYTRDVYRAATRVIIFADIFVTDFEYMTESEYMKYMN